MSLNLIAAFAIGLINLIAMGMLSAEKKQKHDKHKGWRDAGERKRDRRHQKLDRQKKKHNTRDKKREKKRSKAKKRSKKSKNPTYSERIHAYVGEIYDITGEKLSLARETMLSNGEKLHGYVVQSYDYTVEIFFTLRELIFSGYARCVDVAQLSFGFTGKQLSSARKSISTGYEHVHGYAGKAYGYTEKTVSLGYGHAHKYVKQVDETYLLIGVASFALILINKVLGRRRKRELHKRLYGDKVLPPFAPYRITQSGKKLQNILRQSADQVGPVFRLNVPFLSSPLVAVGDIDLAKEILQDATSSKPESFYSNASRIVGNRSNVVTSDGAHWKMSRQGMSPAFAKEYLNRMHKACRDKTEEWINFKLEPSILADEPIDLSKEFTFLTLSIICKTAFEYSIKEKEAQKLIADLEIVTQQFASQQVRSPLRAAFSYFPSLIQANKARKRVQGMGKKILQSYRNKPLRLKSQAETIIGCIENNDQYASDDERIADIVMILFAGHETTAYSLAWVFLELARNPKESLRLRKALNGADDIRAQRLLKDVLREGMRLHPVYQGVGVRTAGRDYFVKDTAMVIPKGAQVMFPSIILTRHGVEDGEKFQPSRWTKHPNKSFLLFSSGKHNCMGQSLALAEMTWVLSRLCAQYELELVDEGKPQFSVFWKCTGAKIKLQRTR